MALLVCKLIINQRESIIFQGTLGEAISSSKSLYEKVFLMVLGGVLIYRINYKLILGQVYFSTHSGYRLSPEAQWRKILRQSVKLAINHNFFISN